MEKEKVTRENIEKHLFVYQLAIVGKTLMDTLDDLEWYFNITLTREQQEGFRNYAIKLIKKTFKCNTSKANSTLDYFISNLGLRIKN